MTQTPSTLTKIFNTELQKVYRWLYHAKKKVVDSESLHIDQYSVTQTNATKFLRVFIDQHLSWETLIHHISTKIPKSMGIITKCKFYLNSNTLRTLFFFDSFIHLIYYRNIIWASTYPTITLSHLGSLKKELLCNNYYYQVRIQEMWGI